MPDPMASHELPAQVAPAAGAEVVEFPWSRASSALAQLDLAATELGNQLTARGGMTPSLVDWEGGYRDDFDETYEAIMDTASGLVETLNSVASAIVSGAEDAVADQTSANNAVELTTTTTI